MFLPGHYPLEILERQLAQHSFAVLVASPDDELIKRGNAYPAMRDNLLLEFGLFVGALGRRHAFFLCPNMPKVELPSDLLGVITATYDSTRISGSIADRAAAVEIPCQQMREVIKEEWSATQRRDAEALIRLQQSEQSRAVQNLYTVASRLRDALMALQRDAFSAFSDRAEFEEAKRRAASEVKELAESFAADARLVGLEQHLEQLRLAATDALLDIPFPQELSMGKEAGREKAFNVGMQALGTYLGGGDPMRNLQDAAADEAAGRMASLRRRYTEWWDRHLPHLQEASGRLQDALFAAVVGIARGQQRIGS